MGDQTVMLLSRLELPILEVNWFIYLDSSFESFCFHDIHEFSWVHLEELQPAGIWHSNPMKAGVKSKYN